MPSSSLPSTGIEPAAMGLKVPRSASELRGPECVRSFSRENPFPLSPSFPPPQALDPRRDHRHRVLASRAGAPERVRPKRAVPRPGGRRAQGDAHGQARDAQHVQPRLAGQHRARARRPVGRRLPGLRGRLRRPVLPRAAPSLVRQGQRRGRRVGLRGALPAGAPHRIRARLPPRPRRVHGRRGG